MSKNILPIDQLSEDPLKLRLRHILNCAVYNYIRCIPPCHIILYPDNTRDIKYPTDVGPLTIHELRSYLRSSVLGIPLEIGDL